MKAVSVINDQWAMPLDTLSDMIHRLSLAIQDACSDYYHRLAAWMTVELQQCSA